MLCNFTTILYQEGVVRVLSRFLAKSSRTLALSRGFMLSFGGWQ